MEVREAGGAQSVRTDVMAILKNYQGKAGGLISALHEIQGLIGYLPEWVQEMTAEALGLPLSEVNSIITFYSLFTEQPKGSWCIGICKGTACYVRGSERLVKRMEEILGIETGQTTPDGLFTLEVLRCLGACGLGPVMTVNEDVYTRVKPEKLQGIIDFYRTERKREGE